MLNAISDNVLVIGFLTLIFSFIVVYYIIPIIIWICNYHKLMDCPNNRSAHEKPIPSMAGFSFFFTIVIVIFFISELDSDAICINYLTSLVVIFFIGLKDDLANSTPKSKLIGETIAIVFILFSNKLCTISLDGFLGIYNLPFVLENILIILGVLTIVNSYNLIDGIDGLAASIGITIISIYALIFHATDLDFYFLFCIALIGILLAYLRYNISKTEKVFMGDTGSLIIGFSIGFLTLKFLSMDASQLSHFTFLNENKILVVVSILCIPLFDAFRVIGVRLLNKKSPFSADRNHVHHILIDYGISHTLASLILALLNCIIVLILIYGSTKYNSFIMIGELLLVYTIYVYIFYKLKQIITTRKQQQAKIKLT